MDAPVFGALTGDCAAPPKWQITTGWRFQHSDKHYVGNDHQEERDHEHSQVVNTIHLVETSVRYSPGPRWSFSVAVPFMTANRSSVLRLGGEIIDRTTVHSEGLGDVTLTARRWMLDPARHPRGNFGLGFGMKLPTGEANLVDTHKRVENGQIVHVDRPVDQSIQPGDGGWGIILDLSGFRRSRSGRHAFYASGTYLSNPQGDNGVKTNRGRQTEAIMSIADQYLVRVGSAFTGPRWRGVTVGAGLRCEGVPPHDAIGSSRHFRRPGFGLMLEPWFSWGGRRHAVTLAVPIAIERNRQVSVPDIEAEPNRHGDAAFADWLLLTSYSYRFGQAKAKAE